MSKEKIKRFFLFTSRVRDVSSTKEVYTPLSRKPTDIDRAELYKDLKECGRFTGLRWLLSSQPPPVSAGFPIEEIIFSEEFLKARGPKEQL